MSGNKDMTKANKDAVIKRINEIITEVNETVAGGRNQNYLRGGKLKKNRTVTQPIAYPYQFMDANGALHIVSSPHGTNPEALYEVPKQKKGGYMPVGAGYMPVGGATEYMPQLGGGNTEYMPVLGGAKKGRKPRSDKGKKRAPNQWQLLVKAVAEYYNIGYNKALKQASIAKKEGYTAEDFK